MEIPVGLEKMKALYILPLFCTTDSIKCLHCLDVNINNAERPFATLQCSEIQ